MVRYSKWEGTEERDRKDAKLPENRVSQGKKREKERRAGRMATLYSWAVQGNSLERCCQESLSKSQAELGIPGWEVDDAHFT